MCNGRNNRGAKIFANIYLLSENEIKFRHLNTDNILLLIQKHLIAQKPKLFTFTDAQIVPLCISRSKQFDPWLTQKPDLNTSGFCFGRVHRSFFTKKTQDKSTEKAVTAAIPLNPGRAETGGGIVLLAPFPVLSTLLRSSTFCLPKTTFPPSRK